MKTTPCQRGRKKNYDSPILSHMWKWGKGEEIMSAYNKLIEFQDEVEHLTGVRPIIEDKMYSHTGGFNDEGALSIRNALVSDSSDELKPVERHLEFDDGGK